MEVIVIQEVGGTKKNISLGQKNRERNARKMPPNSVVSRSPVSELILGTECGGFGFYLRLSFNPAVGAACDMLVAEGGTVILSETPELIGAEHLLAKRARTPEDRAAASRCRCLVGEQGHCRQGRTSERAILPRATLPEA